MKKKLLLIIIALVLALMLVGLVACDSYAGTLQKINTLLDADYAEVKIITETKTSSGYTLNGVYNLSIDGEVTTIEYSYDRYNELSFDDNRDTYLETVTGTAVVQDGVVVEGNSSEALPQVDFNGISFKQAFFSNYTVTDNKFDADVVSVGGFLGNNNFTCNDLHVTVTFTKTAVNKLVITYESAKGFSVSITYLFTLR